LLRLEEAMKIPFALPRQIGIAAFGIALLIAFGWVATKSGPLAPIRVTATPAEKSDVSPSLFGIGTVAARRAYLIGPTTAGRVRRVLVDVGDSVKAGQLLAERGSSTPTTVPFIFLSTIGNLYSCAKSQKVRQ
jgi:HlyD family secretion protein